jgi:DNA-binding CsgD family transcriptional regulator
MTATARDARTTHLALAPLTHEDVARMVAAMVETPVPAAVIDAIYQRAEGNPFVVEELVHAVAHDLTRERRTGASWHAVTERYVPAGMAETIARRLDQCGAGAVMVAECAAVIGRYFSFDLLRRVVNEEEGMPLAALRALIAAHLVIEEEAEGAHAFAFRHALTRDAIYRRLLGPERQRLHRQVAHALDADGPSRPPSESALAHHYFSGEEWGPALAHSQRAGEQAQALYAPHAAIEHFSRALVAAGQIGAPTTAIVFQRAQAYEWIGETEEALRAYEAVLAEARAAGDRATEWQALTRLTRVWGSREHTRAMGLCQEAITIARALGDRASLARNLIQMGAFEALYGEPSAAHGHLEEALAIFQSLDAPQGCADALEWLGVASVTGADLVKAATYLRRAIDLFRTLGDRAGLTRCLVEITQRGATLHGDWLVPETTRILDAAAEGEEALALAQESGWRYGEAYSQGFLALCVGAQGDYARALPWAESALTTGEETGLSSHAFVGHGALGILYLDLLALPAAMRHLQRALALARTIGSPHYLYDTLAFTVSAYLANDEPAKAAALLADALPPETPARTISQRRIWLARAELALAEEDPALALRIVDDLIASAPNIAMVEGRGIPRLSRLRGEALTALGRYAEAEAALTTAAETAQEQGARPLLWRIHLALGALYRTLGRTTEAGQSFATVREIIEEIARTVPDARLRGTFIRKATALIPGVYPLAARRVTTRDADGLTARERAIIAAVARGQSNREMAAALFISEKTAEWHVSNCLRKLGFRTRAELAAWAVASGLATAPHASRTESAIP